MKKLLIRIILGVVVLLIVLLVVVAMSLGSLIKKGVESVGPTLTKTDVRLDSAKVWLLSGSGNIKGFVLGNPQGYKGPFAIKVTRVDLGVQPGSVFSDKVHITHLRIESPEIAIEGSPKDNNLTRIMDNVQAATGGSGTTTPAPGGTGKSSGASKKLQVDDLVVSGGIIHVSTILTAGKEVALPLPDIHLTNLGTGPDGITAAELSKKILSEVTAGSVTALTRGVADLGKGVVDAAGGAAKGAVDSAGKSASGLLGSNTLKGVGDLFKKKQN